MKNYPIEKDVPVPDTGAIPIEDLDVGESMLVHRSERSKVQIKASRLKKNKGMVFTVRVADSDKVRVWRIQ